MRKPLAVLILVLFLFLASGSARAQEPAPLDTVVVHLWPEFDRAEMLVMYEITPVSPDTALPQEVSLRIPAGTELVTVALGETPDTVSTREVTYAVETAGDWTVLTIQVADARAIRVEYYDELAIDGIHRNYTWQWADVFPVNGMRVIFQQPVDASQVLLEPIAGAQMTDASGLVYHQIQLTGPDERGRVVVDVEYQKITPRLSVSVLEIQPITPMGSGAEGRISLSSYMPWLVGIAGLVLIFAGLGVAMTYWRGTGKSFLPRWKLSGAQPEKEDKPAALNCPECGHRLQPGDAFCRVCGTRLIPEDQAG